MSEPTNQFNETKEETYRFLQIDFDRHPEYGDITDLATQLCEKPISFIALNDRNTHRISVAAGICPLTEARMDDFCKSATQQDTLLIVPDMAMDEQLRMHALVQEEPQVRFYACAPLILSNGTQAGMLCLFDFRPGTLTATQQKALRILSRQVTLLMELELSKGLLQAHIAEIESKNEALRAIAHMQSHDIRQPLASIMGLVQLVKENHKLANEHWMQMIGEAALQLDSRIHAIVNESLGNKDVKLLRRNKMVEAVEDCAILLLDEQGHIESWNKGAEKINGYHADEVIGRSFHIFHTAESRNKNLPRRLLQQAKEQGIARDQGWRMRKDGTSFWADVMIAAISDEDGTTVGFTKMTRELTR